MPFSYYCRKCGVFLYYFSKLQQVEKFMWRVMQGKEQCEECGRRLSPQDVIDMQLEIRSVRRAVHG